MQTVPVHPYRVADQPWAATLGSHRAIVRVHSPAGAVLACIGWRRRDPDPAAKDIVVIDRATGKTVANRLVLRVTEEQGEIAFEPVTVPGEYEVYYLPFDQSPQWGLDAGRYKAPTDTAEPEWAQRIAKQGGELPTAEVTAIECRTPFDNASPMGVIATALETAQLRERFPNSPFLLFPTPRELPIRMDDHLPHRWITSGPSHELRVEASRNEYFAFQVGVFAARQALESIAVTFTQLRSKAGSVPSTALRCFNLGGIDRHGNAFTKNLAVPQGHVQALWFGVDVPTSIAPGLYAGTVTIQPSNAPPQSVALRLTITPAVLADRGDSEPWRHSRLRWLDSTIGSEDTLTPPFTPVRATGRTVRILDRTLTFGANGLPTRIASRTQPILHSPVRFVVTTNDKLIEFQRGAAHISSKSDTRCHWETRSAQGVFELHCRATMEFDGFVSYELSLRAARETFVDDVRLEIPLRREMATHLMGMCHRGGRRPPHWEWRWDWSKNQDNVWIGDAHAGLCIQLRDDHYEQPLRVKYTRKPLNLPRSWHNEGYGGCLIRDVPDGSVLFQANCGGRTMKAGEELRFDFALWITPFKPVDPVRHFRTRHFHSDAPVATAVEKRATDVTIHHGTKPYPFINYPFATADELRTHCEEAHRHGLKMRVYYTVRELTSRVPELWALRSLGDEIFLKAEGGGHAWLQENLVRDYSPNWYHPFENGDVDLAITEAASSRWHNYWLEGLRWLIDNVGVDGIYIDDTNLDRVTMRRARRILERSRPGAHIDLHSNDMYWAFYGLGHTSNLYMELFPYIDSLWLGESYDYTRTPPGYWLTELSGIPFGLMGEVMPYARVENPWRAAVYGMHARLPAANERHDPSPLFRVWDEFGVADARMIGYWETDCPVRTDDPDVRATAFVRKGRTLITLASWSETSSRVKLKIDWRALGLNPRQAMLRAPRIEHFQKAAAFRPTTRIPVPSRRGWLLIAE